MNLLIGVLIIVLAVLLIRAFWLHNKKRWSEEGDFWFGRNIDDLFKFQEVKSEKSKVKKPREKLTAIWLKEVNKDGTDIPGKEYEKYYGYIHLENKNK